MDDDKASFTDSIKKDVGDMVNMRNSPGDAVWAGISNLFTRKKPVRFFDIFVALSISLLLLVFLVVLILVALG